MIKSSVFGFVIYPAYQQLGLIRVLMTHRSMIRFIYWIGTKLTRGRCVAVACREIQD